MGRVPATCVKPSLTGDLWSDRGMSLFGIYAHGMTASWVSEKKLIALVACASERHTADNILDEWTEKALEDMGFTAAKLLE